MDDTYALTEAEEKTVQEGEAAGFLLDSPAFLIAIEKVRSDCAEGILRSDPSNHAGREQLYNLSRGLSALTEELLTMKAGALSVIENANKNTPQPEQDVQDEGPDDEPDY